MRKILLLILVCVLLGIIACITWLNKDSTLRIRKDRFQLKNADVITQIHLISELYNSVLQKEGESWKIGHENADAERIKNIFIVTSQFDILSSVPLALTDTVITKMKTGISVRFIKRNKPKLAFDICYLNHQFYARFYPSKKIYRLSVKGYPYIDLIKLFDPNPIYWKSNTIIDLSPETINSISLQYPKKPMKGFQIQRDNTKRIVLLNATGSDTLRNINQDDLFGYLYYFSDIKYTAKNVEIRNANVDSLNKRTFFYLRIISLSEDTIRLYGYRKYYEQSGKIDPDYFYGITSENESLLLNYSDFDPILVTPEYFRKK